MPSRVTLKRKSQVVQVVIPLNRTRESCALGDRCASLVTSNAPPQCLMNK